LINLSNIYLYNVKGPLAGLLNLLLATQLLQMLKTDALFANVTAVGLVSSHPAACTALAKYSRMFCVSITPPLWLNESQDVKIESIDLTYCRENAKQIIEASPVDYVRGMKLCGSLFEAGCTSGAISTVFTGFYVDHTEPLAALQVFKDAGKWPLGELIEGHEFLVILPVG